MSFTLIQSTTDRKMSTGAITRSVDRGVPARVEGSPIGLLLVWTYTN